MGRFYQTSKAQMLDFSLRLPEEMMIASVQFNDAMINQKLEQFDFLSSQLQGDALTADHDDILTGIFDEFGNKIDKHTGQLRDNPLDWRNYSKHISETGKEIFKESTDGQWGQIQGVYNQFHSWKASMDEMVKEDPDKFRGVDADALANYVYSQYGSGLTEERGIKSLGTEGLAEYFDPVGYGIDLAKGWKADAHTEYMAGSDGKYIKKTINGIETVDSQEVFDEIYRSLKGNAKFDSYYSQQFRVQGLEGTPIQVPVYEDEEGNPVYEEIPLTRSMYLDMSAENAAMTAARKEGYTKTETGITDLKVDNIYLEGVKIQGRIQLAKVNHDLDKKMHAYKETYGNIDLADIVTSTTKPHKLFTPDKFNPEFMAEFTEGLATDISKTEGELERANFTIQLAENPESINPDNLTRGQKAIYDAYNEANEGGKVNVDQTELALLKEQAIGMRDAINDSQVQLENLNNLQAKAYTDSWSELLTKGSLNNRDKETYEYYQRNKDAIDEAKNAIEKHNKDRNQMNLFEGNSTLEYYQRAFGETRGTEYYNTLIEDGMFNYSPDATEKKLNTEQQNWYTTNSDLNAALMPVMTMDHINNNLEAKGLLNNIVGEGRIVDGLYLDDGKLTVTQKAGMIGRRNRINYSLDDLVNLTGLTMDELIGSYNTTGRSGADNIVNITLNEEVMKNAGYTLDDYNVNVRYEPNTNMGSAITTITTQIAAPLLPQDKKIVELQNGTDVPIIFGINLQHYDRTVVLAESGRTTSTVAYNTLDGGTFNADVINVAPTEGRQGFTTVSYSRNGEPIGYVGNNGNLIYTVRYNYNDRAAIMEDITFQKDGYTADNLGDGVVWKKVGEEAPVTSRGMTNSTTSSTTSRN